MKIESRLWVTLLLIFLLFITSSGLAIPALDTGDGVDSTGSGSRADDITKTEDWVVTSTEKYEDQKVTVQGDIIIQEGGVLTLTEVELVMDTTENALLINVTEGGTLLVYDSTITISTAVPEEHKGYEFKIFGNVLIDNCNVYYVGHINENSTKNNDTGSSCATGTDLPTYDLPWEGYGIEVYSDNVTVSNSEIKYSLSGVTCFKSAPEIVNNMIADNLYGILVFEGSPKIENNELANNSIGLFCNGSELYIDNNVLKNNQYGISTWFTDLTINASTISNNLEGVFGWNSTVVCKNTDFKSNQYYGISLDDSELVVDNCKVDLSYNGIYIDHTEFSINNSIIHHNWIGIKLDYCTGNITNTNISYNSNQGLGAYDSVLDVDNCTVLGGDPNLYPTNDGISGMLSNFTIYDCIIDGTRAGIENTYSSNFNIYNNLISNNYFGILSISAYQFEVHDNDIVDNTYGIFSGDSNLYVHDNQITQNYVGVAYIQSAETEVEWDINVLDNVIADNTGWGVYLLNNEPDVSQNVFIDGHGNANGEGILLQEYSLVINVYDSNDDPVVPAIIEIRDQHGFLLVDGMTNADGVLEIENVTSYKISNANTKIYSTPLEVTVKWGAETWGYVSETQTIDLTSFTNLTFKLDLPDVYIADDDITITKSNPKSGDKVTIEATVHYTGDMPASDFTVTFKANSEILDEVKIDRMLDGDSKKVTAEWEVYSIIDDEVTISVRVEPPWGFEYHRDVYWDNNNASIEVEVKGEDGPDTGFSMTGDECLAIAPVIFIIFVVILIVIFAFVWKRRKAKRMSEEEDKEKEEEREPGPGKGRRLPPRGPPPRRPPMQPPMRGRPPQKPGTGAGGGGVRRVENPWK